MTKHEQQHIFLKPDIAADLIERYGLGSYTLYVVKENTRGTEHINTVKKVVFPTYSENKEQFLKDIRSGKFLVEENMIFSHEGPTVADPGRGRRHGHEG